MRGKTKNEINCSKYVRDTQIKHTHAKVIEKVNRNLHIHELYTLLTPYSDIIAGNSSVYVQNENQREDTRNRHCDKFFFFFFSLNRDRSMYLL